MTETEEIIIYDTMITIQDRAPALVALLQERGTAQEVAAYKSGIYASVVRLGSLFTPDQLAANEARHRKIRAEIDAFFTAKAKTKQETLNIL